MFVLSQYFELSNYLLAQTLEDSFADWTGLDTGSNLQKLKVPEISSGPRQEKRDKPDPRLTGLVPLVPGLAP